MGVGLVTVGRREYAVGLYWENSPGGSIAKAAKEAAQQPEQKAAFYAVRDGNKTGRIAQFGLAAEDPRFRFGQPVLAACLANQQPGSWAGAFRLREGIAVIVMRDDLIVPDGDLLFSDEMDARERLMQEMGFGGLQRIYAPEAWSVPGADTMPLSLLLNDKTDIYLRPVEIPRKVIFGALGAVGVILAILAGGWIYQEQQAQEDVARQAQFAALQKAQAKARQIAPPVLTPQKEIVYPPPERVWEKKPLAMEVLQNCKDGLIQIPLAVVGWKMSALRCDGLSVSVTWARTTGYAIPPEKSTVDDSGTTAQANFPLTSLKPRGNQDLIDVATVTRRILKQNWGGKLARMQPDALPPPPPGYDGPWNPPLAPWVKRSFTVNASVLPGVLSSFFEDFPGLIITNMSMKGNNGAWEVEGVIYENLR